MSFTSKAYGKLLVFGAYSILEQGNIGLVVNVNRGTKVTAKETSSGRFIFDLKNFRINIKAIRKGNLLEMMMPDDSVSYVKSAVECCFEYLNHLGKQIKDMEIITENDPELSTGLGVKTGLGSSATSTVATVASVLRLHDIDDRDIVYKISRYSHHKVQDGGSGFDIAASVYGSCYFVQERAPDQDMIDYIKKKELKTHAAFDWPAALLPLVIFTGKSASTKSFIQKVQSYKKKSPEEYNAIMKKYNAVNLRLRESFEENNILSIKNHLEESWSMRRKLGLLADAQIEPEIYTALISEIKKHGAFTAGLMGAGGGDSLLAIYLNLEDKARLLKFLDYRQLLYFDDLMITSKGYEFL